MSLNDPYVRHGIPESMPGDASPAIPGLPEPNYHFKFCTLTMLLTLVTNINSGGCFSNLPQSYEELYLGAFNNSQPASNLVLNVLAAILVQDHEIITTTTPNVIKGLVKSISLIAM